MEVTTENAIIDFTHLGFEHHHIFSWGVGFKFSNSSQGTGQRFLNSKTIDEVKELLEILGVDSWEELKGTKVRVKRNSRIVAIGHYLEDKWITLN